MIPPLLRENPNFRRFFMGQAVSLLGDQITLIALPLTAVLALDASAAQMGALTTVALVPNLIFSLHAGSWVDRRGGRRQVMLATDIARGVLVATIPIAFAFGQLTWTLLYVVAFGSGTLSVFFYVAYGGFFQTIVRREDYVTANSLSHGARAFSFLAGTSVGGVLVQLLRGPYALAVDAVSFIWSASFLARVDAPDPRPEQHDTGGVLAGARWIRRNAIIRAELLGVVLGVASVGTLIGSFVTAPLSRRFGVGPTFLLGCFLFPAPLVLVPAAGGPKWLVVALLFVAEAMSGFGLMLLDILAGAIMAGVIPPTLRSRVSGAFMLVNNGVRPVGTALGGLLGSAIGLRPTLWIATVGALAGLAWLLPSPIRRLHEVPEEAPA